MRKTKTKSKTLITVCRQQEIVATVKRMQKIKCQKETNETDCQRLMEL